jgi:hypothetical protein
MSGIGPPSYYDPNPGNLYASQEHHADQRLFEHGVSEYDRQQYANQIGGMHAEAQRRDAELAQRLADQQRRHAAGEYGSATAPSSAASFRPTPVRQPLADVPKAVYQPPPHAVYRPEPGKRVRSVIVVVALIVLAIVGLAWAINTAYRHATRDVTLTEMGIQDQSKASWSWDNGTAVEYGFHVVTFYLNTENTSDEERKVKFCSRKEPGTTDNCYSYKVAPHSTWKQKVTMKHARFGLDEQNTIGPDARIVKIDGYHVRA